LLHYDVLDAFGDEVLIDLLFGEMPAQLLGVIIEFLLILLYFAIQ
jgi:hypothetical protein